MRATLATLLAIAGLPSVRAQVYACDGLTFPDYDNCDVVMAGIPWKNGPDDEWGQIADGFCASFTEPGNVGNCIIQACNQRGDGATQPLNVFSGPAQYSILKNWCKPDGLGGSSPATGSWITKALNNPEYSPPSAAKRAAKGNVVAWTMSLAESEALVAQAKQVNIERLQNDISKRQDPTFTLLATAKNLRTSERSRLSAVAGSGSQQQWSTTEGYSTSVSTSAEMGVNLFEIFSASVSITVTQEFSVSYTETLVFDPSGRCDPAQDAVLYFYPLYDQYVGIFSGDSTEYTVNIPVEGANNYAIDVECLG